MKTVEENRKRYSWQLEATNSLFAATETSLGEVPVSKLEGAAGLAVVFNTKNLIGVSIDILDVLIDIKELLLKK